MPMVGTITIEPEKVMWDTSPPMCSGQPTMKVVLYTDIVGFPSCNTVSGSSKLEETRPSQPPPAPDHSDPGRKSILPSARQPE
jgi:hypothetical protein